MITFTRLKYLSFVHSGVYLALLALWLTDGPATPRTVLGWAHGVGWIAMSLLCIVAVRLRVIPLWLAVMVAVVGGVGPFAGSIGFVVCERRAARPGSRPVGLPVTMRPRDRPPAPPGKDADPQESLWDFKS